MEYFIAPVNPEDVLDKTEFAVVQYNGDDQEGQHVFEVFYYQDGIPRHGEGFRIAGVLNDCFRLLGDKITSLPAVQFV